RRLSRVRLPYRAHHHAPLRPSLSLLAHLLAHRHGILIALGDHLQFTFWPLPHDRAEALFATPDGRKGRVQCTLGQLHLRQRAQVKITWDYQSGSRLTRRHLTVTHIKQPRTTPPRLPPLNTGHIERVIGPLT